jgi:site-specific recombinase XerD
MPSKPSVAYIDDFLAHIDVARKTETTYRYGLQAFGEFLLQDRRAGHGVAQTHSPSAVAPTSLLRDDTLAQFRRWMRHERNLSRPTEGTYLAAAVRYVEWLDANRYLPGDITSSRMVLILRSARGRRRSGYKTQPIKEAVPLIIAYFDGITLPDPAKPRGRRQRLSILRNRAIAHTLFATGLRAQELVSLRRSDCADGAGEKMLITGKGEKERVVSLNAEAQTAIRAYLHARDDDRAQHPNRRARLALGEDPLFVRHDRDQATAITTKTVWQIINDAARALGLGSRVSPHDFRRYIATTMLSEGMPLESVQAFLGHESIVTTRTVYAHTWTEVLDDQVQTYRPSPAQALRRAKQMRG